MKIIRLREGRDRSLLRRHPWVFEGSIAKGKADAGETVRVESAEGAFLCWASFSPNSLIRVRAWSFDEQERIDAAFFAANGYVSLLFLLSVVVATPCSAPFMGASLGLAAKYAGFARFYPPSARRPEPLIEPSANGFATIP